MDSPRTWHPQARNYKQPPFTVEAPNQPHVEGETIPRRNHRCRDGLAVYPEEGVQTIFDIIRHSAEKYGNAKALGHRKLIRTVDEVKKIKKVVDGKEKEEEKTWTFSELSEYHYMSFIEYERMVLQAGSGLRSLGMNASDRLHIFAATSPFWLSMAHAAASQSMPIVTAYDTLGEVGLQHSMKQTGAKAIFLDPHLLPKLNKPLNEAKSIQYVIYNSEQGKVKQEHIDALKRDHPHLTICGFDELLKRGKEQMVDAVPPKPDDLCCIMYTSGSTGTPKGVLLKHRNVVAGIAGVNVVVGGYLGPGDGLLTYLPLAHILEFVFENTCLYWGGTMGYGNPRTLVDTSVRNCKGDIREFKPTILVGVPAVWETVRKGVLGKVNASNPIVRNMFWAGMKAKSAALASGIPGSESVAGILDSVIFNKVKDATGGRLRICLNGGGAISTETQRFISLAITPMINGYGLTETCGMGAITDPGAWTDEAVGEVTGSVELKLVDYADAGYHATNNPPQGEVWIRGAAVTEGYLDLEEENRESFTKDGWFKTGDIGEFDHKGQLRIIDRKKNLVKTLNGEYIALEKLESTYRSTPVIQNILVHADPNKSKPIAIIVPVEPVLKKLADANGIKGSGLDDYCQNKKLNGIVLKEMLNVGKAGGLQGIELIEGVVLAPDEWTPESGLVTSAMKLNRKVITEKYKKEVEQAYSGSS